MGRLLKSGPGINADEYRLELIEKDVYSGADTFQTKEGLTPPAVHLIKIKRVE